MLYILNRRWHHRGRIFSLFFLFGPSISYISVLPVLEEFVSGRAE
jgi:hypothetical protein